MQIIVNYIDRTSLYNTIGYIDRTSLYNTTGYIDRTSLYNTTGYIDRTSLYNTTGYIDRTSLLTLNLNYAVNMCGDNLTTLNLSWIILSICTLNLN